MVTKTFLDKSNTIIKGSKDNFGQNTICSLNYGENISRCLIHFNLEKLTNLCNDGTYPYKSSLTHILKLTNAGSIDDKYSNNLMNRASSFDIVFFKIPKLWDAGVGADSINDFWIKGKGALSTEGSNWYYARTNVNWDNNGIYSDEELSEAYEIFKVSGYSKDNIVVGVQHFDHGNENIELNITEYINNILNGEEENFGIGFSFSPSLESLITFENNYVGFFNHNTNTIFTPCLETRYNESIADDRYQFCLGKTNRLYFTSLIDDCFVNLDTLPICTINGAEMPVSAQTKGIYYANVTLTSKTFENTIQYDTWSNIKYKGETLNDVELEFVVHSRKDREVFGEISLSKKRIVPSVYGINDNESLNQEEVREVNLIFKVPYLQYNYVLVNNAKYRIYTKDADKEIDWISWDNINISKNLNYFTINASEFLPQNYFVDIKVQIGNETLLSKEILKFRIINNRTNIKR